MAADVCFNYRLRLKSHVAIYLFIYLYLNEFTESLIAVVLVADSVKRGRWMQAGLCVQQFIPRVACKHRDAQTDCTLLDTQLIRTKVYTGLYSPWVGWGWRLGTRQ